MDSAVSASAVGTRTFATTTDALVAKPGQIGLGLMAMSWAGLAVAQWRARPAGRVLEQSLRTSFGRDDREQIPAARRSCARAPVGLQIHGGGWVMGNEYEQALLLIHHLAARGCSPTGCVPYRGMRLFTPSCPGVQYARDVFRAVRAMESVRAVARFLEWAHAAAIS